MANRKHLEHLLGSSHELNILDSSFIKTLEQKLIEEYKSVNDDKLEAIKCPRGKEKLSEEQQRQMEFISSRQKILQRREDTSFYEKYKFPLLKQIKENKTLEEIYATSNSIIWRTDFIENWIADRKILDYTVEKEEDKEVEERETDISSTYLEISKATLASEIESDMLIQDNSSYILVDGQREKVSFHTDHKEETENLPTPDIAEAMPKDNILITPILDNTVINEAVILKKEEEAPNVIPNEKISFVEEIVTVTCVEDQKDEEVSIKHSDIELPISLEEKREETVPSSSVEKEEIILTPPVEFKDYETTQDITDETTLTTPSVKEKELVTTIEDKVNVTMPAVSDSEKENILSVTSVTPVDEEMNTLEPTVSTKSFIKEEIEINQQKLEEGEIESIIQPGKEETSLKEIKENECKSLIPFGEFLSEKHGNEKDKIISDKTLENSLTSPSEEHKDIVTPYSEELKVEIGQTSKIKNEKITSNDKIETEKSDLCVISKEVKEYNPPPTLEIESSRPSSLEMEDPALLTKEIKESSQIISSKNINEVEISTLEETKEICFALKSDKTNVHDVTEKEFENDTDYRTEITDKNEPEVKNKESDIDIEKPVISFENRRTKISVPLEAKETGGSQINDEMKAKEIVSAVLPIATAEDPFESKEITNEVEKGKIINSNEIPTKFINKNIATDRNKEECHSENKEDKFASNDDIEEKIVNRTEQIVNVSKDKNIPSIKEDVNNNNNTEISKQFITDKQNDVTILASHSKEMNECSACPSAIPQTKITIKNEASRPNSSIQTNNIETVRKSKEEISIETKFETNKEEQIPNKLSSEVLEGKKFVDLQNNDAKDKENQDVTDVSIEFQTGQPNKEV
ncbi:repetitive organellar protein-like [Centruroides vittatus]|uniref:repetitive organellar protein-like n=1 Tax=Centruroides vittatus TaxID=120091 RepID=UPI003510156E